VHGIKLFIDKDLPILYVRLNASNCCIHQPVNCSDNGNDVLSTDSC